MIPQFVMDMNRMAVGMSQMLGVPHATTTSSDGLYVGLRSRRLDGPGNRKFKFYTVRLRRGGVEIFRSEESVKGFPSEHLIAQLMLIT